MAENKIIFVFLFALFNRSEKTWITDKFSHCLHERRVISDVSTFGAVLLAYVLPEPFNIFSLYIFRNDLSSL